MEPGLFVTFFNKDEPRSLALPPVGPLDNAVFRYRQLIAERTAVHQGDEFGVPIERWLAAELEFQRATGAEPGGMKRTHLRFSSRDGLFVRFLAYGDAQEQRRVMELGPFDVVTIGPREVEAEGRVIATLAVADFPTWALNVGEAFAGIYKPDVALRAEAGKYHPSITTPVPGTSGLPTLPPSLAPEPVIAPPLPAPPSVYRARESAHAPVPVAPVTVAPLRREEPPALAPRDAELVKRIEEEQTADTRAADTLRSRIFDENRQRASAKDPGEPAAWSRYRPQAATPMPAATTTDHTTSSGFSFGDALWRWRFAIIGVLLVGMVTYAAYIGIRTAAPAGPQYTTVNVAQRFTGTRWDWTVNNVRRAQESGSVRAQGTFYVVNLAATNKATEDAALSSSVFTLIDANGVEHPASGVGVYRGPPNPNSPNIWPAAFPVGRPVTFSLFFDVDPSIAKGNLLAIADAPTIRVRLD